MARFTNKQIIDLQSIEYFIADESVVTNQDRHDFMLHSDRGIIPDNRRDQVRIGKGQNGTKYINLSFFTNKELNGYQQLFVAKSRRGLHAQMWEEGILEGSTPLISLFSDVEGEKLPKPVMEYMAGTVFKGNRIQIIRDLWHDAWLPMRNIIRDTK